MHRAYLALVLPAAVACGEPSTSSEGGGTTAADATTSASTADPGTTSTSATPTGDGSSGAPESGDPDPTTGPGTGGDSSTGAVLDTGGETTGSTGGETGGESTSGGTTEPEETLVLDPATLNFFWLPINSLRAGVGGFDAATNTCVTVIFSFDGFADAMSEHCAFDPMIDFPYVVVTPDAAPPCEQWDYAGNVTLESATGCQLVTSGDPLLMDIAMELSVSGAPFTGKITVESP